MARRRRGPEFNTHHDIWTKADCERLGRAAIWLRQQPDLTPKLEIQTHQELHVRTLPFKLSREFYKEARDEWENNGKPLEAIDRLLSLIDRLENDPELADRAIAALESQIKFIEYGIEKEIV